jgi:large subunit ribosomal protein L10
MAKTRAQKEQDVARLTAKIRGSKAAAFAQVSGLTMPQADELRSQARQVGVEVFIAKKTLLKLATDQAEIQNIDPKTFEGSILTAVSYDDEVSAAKVIADFSKKNEVLTLVAGILEGKGIGATEVKQLAALPSKEMLYAQLVGSLNAPISGFVNVLAGNLRGLVTVLDKVREQKA